MSLVSLAVIALTRTASADPRHVLVLHAEGSADAQARARIDTQVLKLAKGLPDAKVDPGEIAFSDATVAAGCEPAEPTCKDQVLTTLGVDELVATTVDATTAGELKIEVRLLSKTGVKTATTTVPAGQSPDAKMNADIGPMFGLVPPAPTGPRPFDGQTTAPPTTPPPLVTTAPTLPATNPTVDHAAAPTQTAQATVTGAPDNQVAAPPDTSQDTRGNDGHRTLEWAGMITGGALAIAGVVFWLEANDTQNQINAAPTVSSANFTNLVNLESQGDSYAAAGNVLFISGAVIGLASGYFFWRDHGSADHHVARVVPTVMPHGGGIAIQLGGGP